MEGKKRRGQPMARWINLTAAIMNIPLRDLRGKAKDRSSWRKPQIYIYNICARVHLCERNRWTKACVLKKNISCINMFVFLKSVFVTVISFFLDLLIMQFLPLFGIISLHPLQSHWSLSSRGSPSDVCWWYCNVTPDVMVLWKWMTINKTRHQHTCTHKQSG